ncbi:hypothetical protein M406DRAFT_70757 [Cryphonectria parasitica EP155]|uniref:C2H2-type domain-containing protein n=1 Tax=Cryphonectria parasitica (strain ATCC 38755 / EP155) TaxID=660469 RepID=A0A9P5CP22_CRYP1|nr:uncharacterized protein M406DRAFT_70757 [Cryphonectria parasitica EP155]KAF3764721.1 hypothetical protein M406DRAFT_70757 [Cryphonectria parasitica EP155]
MEDKWASGWLGPRPTSSPSSILPSYRASLLENNLVPPQYTLTCTVPGCSSAPFMRAASLQRHVAQYHQTTEQPQQGPVAQTEYPCLFAGCLVAPFKRFADLDRHTKHVHSPKSLQTSRYCDWSKGKDFQDTAGDSPFTRKDHFKAHRRDYQLEPLQS